jgi:hypothetical protein
MWRNSAAACSGFSNTLLKIASCGVLVAFATSRET